MPAFIEGVRAIERFLREDAPSHSVLNRAASHINQLGLKLHGLGFVHDREIADDFTAAIGELGACHALAVDRRAEAVHQVVRHLEEAVRRMQTGGLSP